MANIRSPKWVAWNDGWTKASATAKARRSILRLLTDRGGGVPHFAIARAVRLDLGKLCDDSVTCEDLKRHTDSPEWDHRVRAAEIALRRRKLIWLSKSLGLYFLTPESTPKVPRVQDIERAQLKIRNRNYRVENKIAEVKVRAMQAAFSREVKRNYGMACALCDIQIPNLLVASHIRPWSVDLENRLNPANGICLCVLHDRLFDKGLISIDQDRRVMVSAQLRRARGRVTARIVADLAAAKLRLPRASAPGESFLDYHRGVIYRS